MSEVSPTFEIPQLGVDDHVTGECSPETLRALDIIGGDPMMHLSVVALTRDYRAGGEGLRAVDVEHSVAELVPLAMQDKLPSYDAFWTLAKVLREQKVVTEQETDTGTYFRLNADQHRHIVALSTLMIGVANHYSDQPTGNLWPDRRVRSEGERGTSVLRHEILRRLEASGVSSSPSIATEMGVDDFYTWGVCNRLATKGVLRVRDQPHAKERWVSFTPPSPDFVPETDEAQLLADLAHQVYKGDGTPLVKSEHELGQCLQHVYFRVRRMLIRNTLVQAQLQDLPFIGYVNPEHGLKGSQVVEFSPDWLRPVKALLQGMVNLSDNQYRDAAHEQAFTLQPADTHGVMRHYTKNNRAARTGSVNVEAVRRGFAPPPPATTYYNENGV